MNPAEPYQGNTFDGSWAEEWVRMDGVQRTQMYDQVVRGRLLPAIADPEEEAQTATQNYWNERMSEVGGDVDAGHIADVANEKGVEMYELIFPLRQSALNLGTAGLFHLFEQSATSLGRAWIRGECRNLDAFVEWIETNLAIDLKTQALWSTIHELELVANVIKHGEGRSAQELRGINQALFELPGMYGLTTGLGSSPVAAPLAGGDIYVTDADFEKYVGALTSLWTWLGLQLKGRTWVLPR